MSQKKKRTPEAGSASDDLPIVPVAPDEPPDLISRHIAVYPKNRISAIDEALRLVDQLGLEVITALALPMSQHICFVCRRANYVSPPPLAMEEIRLRLQEAGLAE